MAVGIKCGGALCVEFLNFTSINTESEKAPSNRVFSLLKALARAFTLHNKTLVI